jgi:regulator of sigma D|tara:strand:+ start:491 stop:694 length:204 start_codon:yes stop_codon:yes gene_type:complete
MNEIYNDLNRLKTIKEKMSYDDPLLDEMIEEKEHMISIHEKELTIQGGRELITELFGSTMATKMGVI